MAKSQTYKEDIYPNNFSDDDKINFDNLLSQAISIYPNIEVWVMKIAIVAHINKENNRGIPLDKEESFKLKEQYLSNIKGVYETSIEQNNILTNE